MKEYNIGREYLALSHASSKGTQTKYFKDGYWYKTNNVGNEGLAEELVSKILKCSNVKYFVDYEQCIINGKKGCRSENFLKPGEAFTTFQRLYHSYAGGNLNDHIKTMGDVKDRFDYLVGFVKETTGLDCSDYLRNNFSIDMLIRNPDRHFHNLGVIRCENGTYRETPIFDNGQGLLQNFTITPPLMEPDEKEEALSAATISGSFEAQVSAAGNILKIDYDRLYDLLDSYEDGIAKNYLCRQLKKYRAVFSENKVS